MGKMTVQNFVVKIHSDRLAKNKWNLDLPLSEAHKNDEVVALASSQVLRWIDELNGLSDVEDEVITLKKRLKFIKKQKNSAENKRKIRRIYERLDELQFKPDYVIIVMDKMAHFKRAAKGFTINGIKYVRLLSSAGQVKTGSSTYISERLYEEINRRIDNGRNKEIPLVPAKLESYRALTCSSSKRVTTPRIAVVPDCETHFKEDTLFLSYGDADEPVSEFVENAELDLTESDGYGLILPSMAEQWSKDLGLDYVPGAFIIRSSWAKGAVLPFDFIRFADEVAKKRKVEDVWGNEIDLSETSVILTASMLKLYECYDSCQHYVDCCEENKYDFAVTKWADSELDPVRATNYQFLAPYDLSDDDIDELLSDSINTIKDIVSQNSATASLFLHGSGVAERNPVDLVNDFSKGLLIDSRLHNDPYVMNRIYNLVKKKIRDLSIGVVDVQGNFSIIGGDPWSLMQNTFGMEVTGLLPPHTIYSSFWRQKGVSDVVAFRAPMSTAENIVKMHVSDSDKAADWYSHINNVTLMSSFSGECHSLNGADKLTCPPPWRHGGEHLVN